MRAAILAVVAGLAGCHTMPVVCPPLPAPPSALMTVPAPLPPIPIDMKAPPK